MRTDSLRRIDSFPYRHRVAELMSAPLVSALPEATVAEVSRLMSKRQISSVVAVDHQGRPSGILTERDILRIVATDPALLSRQFGEVMSYPVHTVGSGALAYRAIGRMSRHGVRHLVVVDDDGRAVGMLTAGALLKQRATLALTLGDEIDQATEADALREAHGKLSSLAAALRVEEVPAVQVSAVVSGIVCDLTARAAALAAASMPAPAPAPWCLLVLGSAGRGESLLAADQDNALIHEGDEHDPWFGTFADRLNEILATAGIPLCAGGVMARNAAFRGTPATWRGRVEQWVAKPQPGALLNVDIFYGRFSRVAKAKVDLATSFLFFLFLGVLIWQSADMAWESAEKLERSSSIWNPHIWPVKLAIPIAGILLLLQGLVRIASDIRTVMGLENDPAIFGKQATDEPSH